MKIEIKKSRIVNLYTDYKNTVVDSDGFYSSHFENWMRENYGFMMFIPLGDVARLLVTDTRKKLLFDLKYPS